nr:hypothetical protein [Thioclava sp.]
MGKQRKALARVRFKRFEARRLRRAKQPASLSQSGFEQPLKWFFARFEACFFEHAPVQAGESLFLLVQEK